MYVNMEVSLSMPAFRLFSSLLAYECDKMKHIAFQRYKNNLLLITLSSRGFWKKFQNGGFRANIRKCFFNVFLFLFFLFLLQVRYILNLWCYTIVLIPIKNTKYFRTKAIFHKTAKKLRSHGLAPFSCEKRRQLLTFPFRSVGVICSIERIY